jgi:hypothetical protein
MPRSPSIEHTISKRIRERTDRIDAIKAEIATLERARRVFRSPTKRRPGRPRKHPV